MKHAAFLLALTLAACAPRADTPADRCARQADEDPAYKADLAKAAGSGSYQWEHAPQIQAERQSAIDRCLGGTTGHRGGVERPR